MKVTVIGLGPGGGADLTGRARAALEACDLIVGYTAYIDLVRADFPQKETLSTGMRREVDRCRCGRPPPPPAPQPPQRRKRWILSPRSAPPPGQ